MKKLLQINITANWGSHGKIAEGIGQVALSQGWQSYIAYGRRCTPSQSTLFHIGNPIDEIVHGIGTRLLDNHGLMSKQATKKLIAYIEEIQPSIIHLHNIHGYYLNYQLLFRYLSQSNIPIVWTLHDCWAFTGHCAHYMYTECNRWKSHCQNCPQKQAYPKSLFQDRSYKNFEQKKESFLSVDNLTLVPVSKWLEKDLKQSFLKDKRMLQIYNGIDTDTFKRQADTSWIRKKYGIPLKNIIVLGVASNWYRKGLDDFIKLRSLINDDISIVVVGLNAKERKQVNGVGIIGINRTDNVEELVALYSLADVYFNPTWEDNFPTTILEAMACGTPVVTYNTGGCSEAIENGTGYVISQGDLLSTVNMIEKICDQNKEECQRHCAQWTKEHFDKINRFQDYIKLYNEILKSPE